MCLLDDGFDPAHYYILPDMSRDSALKKTAIALKLIREINAFLIIEQGSCGGISECCNWYAEANNIYIRENYNAQKPESYVLYYDVNNLYGWAMIQSLPYGGFELVDPSTTNWDVADDAPVGYMLGVDLSYSQELHDLQKDLPFCAEYRCPLAQSRRSCWPLCKRKDGTSCIIELWSRFSLMDSNYERFIEFYSWNKNLGSNLI